MPDTALPGKAEIMPTVAEEAEERAPVREVSVPAVVRAAAMLRLLSNAAVPLGVN
jgi:hypothetical protein